MSITSLDFLLFLLAVLIVYFVAPKRVQWVVLLIASIGFYLTCGVRGALYVLITATTVYIATRIMGGISARQKAYLKENKLSLSKEEKQACKAKNQRRRKTVMLMTLLLNIGLLCAFKYFHFLLEQLNAVIGLFGGAGIEDTFSLIAPLGISFYTFQSVGYLVDVYWEHYEPEKNYLKVLLFVCFFPQMTQGPISDFEQLSHELFTEHRFEYKNFSWGAQRMLWGFAKKMLLANSLAIYVNDVFANYASYSGITVFIGALMYSVQIYADFSGYMDIMCGFCEMLGIHLTENFERPYFSKDVAEYWRRWHISLGAWFKKYIYYPIGMSNWSRRFAKNTREKFGKHFANSMPATIALVVTWLATGLWHGASWAYAVWGLVNGLFIIAELWMEPVYDKWKKGLHIRESAWAWRAFQTVRTFLLVTFIKVLPEVGTLSDGWGLWKQIFANHVIPTTRETLLPFVTDTDNLWAVLIATALLFITSLIQRKKPVRQWLNEHSCLAVRVALFALIFVATVYFGVPVTDQVGGGFMYAEF